MTGNPDKKPAYAVTCSGCGNRFRIQEAELGHERPCPTCHEIVRLPSAEVARRARRAALARAEFSFRCKLCGTVMYANPTQVGSSIPCPDCDSPNRVPPVPAAPVKKQRIQEDHDPYRLQEDSGNTGLGPLADSEDRIRVFCGKCEAMMYARPDQVGKSIPCVDCGAVVLVRPQPKRKKTVVTLEGAEVDIEPTFERASEVKSLDRFIRAGTAYADRVFAERPIPPKRPFLSGVYTFPFYPEILARWVAIAAIFMTLVPFVTIAAEAQGVEMFVAIPLFLLFVFVMLLLIFAVSSYLMTILYFTAGGYNRVMDWPRLSFFERIVYVLYPAGATIASTAPLGLTFAWLPWFQSAAVQALGIIFLFPIALLSMVDSASPAMPYSRLVWGSLFVLPWEWCKFYLATLPIWLLLAAWIAVVVRWPEVWVVASLFVGAVFAWTVFFRLIGRLAWVIDQKMPAEPLDDEIA